MKKVTKQKLKVVSSLELHADYYSLVYFGFWLDSDEEELSSVLKKLPSLVGDVHVLVYSCSSAQHSFPISSYILCSF